MYNFFKLLCYFQYINEPLVKKGINKKFRSFAHSELQAKLFNSKNFPFKIIYYFCIVYWKY